MRNEELSERNLRSLRKMYPEYADLVSAVPDGADYAFESSGDAVLCKDSRGAWLHGPDDPRPQATAEAERVVEASAGLYIVLRPGLGYQAFAILDAIEKRSPGSLLLVVEDRLDLFKEALSLTNWAAILHTPFTVLLLGSPATVIEAFFERHPKISLLPVTLVAGVGAMNVPECRDLVERLTSISERNKKEADDELAGADIRISQRRTRGEALRVLLAGPEFGYLSSPIADGFRALGCSVEIHTGDVRTLRNVRAHEWFWHVWSRGPDLVLWLNRPELSRFGSDALRTLEVASVLWTVDSPRRMQLTASELSTVDLHVCFDGAYLPACAPLGARDAGQLSLAAGIDPLPGCTPSDIEWPRRRGPDLTFVGSLGESRIADLREFIRYHDADKLALLDALALEATDPAPAFERETGRPYEGIPCLYIDEMRLARRRIDVLSRLPRSSLRIYGGKDWAGDRSPLAKCYAGRSIGYGPDLSYVYYHSLINLNIFHAQCLNSTNSRVYDVLAVGGFLLTEDSPALHREFEVGRHLVTFSSPAEASDKAAYYLAHPAEREAIAREGQRHVLAHHTFAGRCRQLLARARPFMGELRQRQEF